MTDFFSVLEKKREVNPIGVDGCAERITMTRKEGKIHFSITQG
jgi:hypothetical protein